MKKKVRRITEKEGTQVTEAIHTHVWIDSEGVEHTQIPCKLDR